MGISVLLVGDVERTEFHDARMAIERAADVTIVRDVDSAVRAMESAEAPVDLIVVAQSHPGEFSAEAIDRLRRLLPLARFVALLGSWCEGEMRSGRPWPGATRVYWHQWLPQSARELGRLHDGRCSTWALPPTAGDEERLVIAAEDLPQREGLVGIYSSEFDMFDWLAAVCRRQGYRTVWLRPGQGMRLPSSPSEDGSSALRALIFDGTECRGEELDELRRLAAAVAAAPVVMLLNFPRVEDRDRALAAGAAAVLSKPLLVEDLSMVLEQMTNQMQNDQSNAE